MLCRGRVLRKWPLFFASDCFLLDRIGGLGRQTRSRDVPLILKTLSMRNIPGPSTQPSLKFSLAGLIDSSGALELESKQRQIHQRGEVRARDVLEASEELKEGSGPGHRS